ncbi:bifunctional DNA primase/polymerase [uncultured Actinomyces sp.]|uniref:bifunctional DNA primase/polymerase n=1 Tax=uncultured Actinomyces sp. TaxID=249061 RepID=UPI00288C0F6F|nr:bifunctional DNA primase/polymerase [uncultured Actinomyces sp.]
MSLARPVMLEAALIYARAGWRVLPCRATGAKAKAPHITKWQHNATTDPSTVKRWWNKWSNALIGVMVPDDVVVIDIDPRNGGSVQALEALAGGVLPPTLIAVSGGRDSGRHLYYKRPEGFDKSVIGCLPGIDVIVSGRFMIAPPSLHPDTGRPYRWENKTQPAMMPTGLIQALTRTTASAPSVSTGEKVKGGYTRSTPYLPPSKRIALTRKAQESIRNTSLSRTAFIGYLEGWAPKYIEQLRQAAIDNGLSAKEVDNTLKSARKKAREIQAGGRW